MARASCPRVAAGIVVLAAFATMFTSAPHAAGASVALTTRVSYLAGGTVYLEAGRSEGLLEGDTLAVTRGNASVALLRVTFLSSHRAACDTFSVTAELRNGDAVRFIAHTANAVAPPSAARGDSLNGVSPIVPNSSHPRRDAAPFHGRIGARFLSVQDHGVGGGFSQPALDLRLDGVNVDGSALDVSVDARSRRTLRTLPGGSLFTESSTRVYRASISMHDRATRYRMTLGRQTSPTLASVSIFDGALAVYTGTHVNFGAFSGTQPDPVSNKFSTSILEHGVYAEMHQQPLTPRHWSVALGGVTSSQAGQTNRDFIFTQGYYQTPRVSASVAQEVDINRGWKLALGEHRLSPTSTFIMTRVQVIAPLSLSAGYDNRRNVRLYRDRLTPETEFEDRYRAGAWMGATYELGRHVRLSGDARQRGGAPSDHTHAWSSGAEFYRFRMWNATLRARYSRFTSASVLSRLTSLALGLDPHSALHLEATGGTRESKETNFSTTETVRWFGVDMDLALAQRWYLNGSFEHDRGGFDNLTQEYAGLSWRF